MVRPAFLVVVLLSACNPVKSEDVDAGPDASSACTSGSQCSAPTPVCASNGVCVGCEQASDCTGRDAPVCDPGTRSCRGCSKDSECAGGVCIEAEGRCVADGDVAFVTMEGNDTGTCTRSAPCQSIAYAFMNRGARQTIHVLGGALFNPTVVLGDAGSLAVDGEDTTFTTGNTATLVVQGASDVLFEGFRVNEPIPGATGPAPPALSVTGAGAKAHFHDLVVDGQGGTAVASLLGARATVTGSHVGNLSSNDVHRLDCSNSTMVVSDSVFETAIVGSQTSCNLTVRGNRFESTRDGSVQISGGILLMENNLILHRDGLNDSISVGNLSAGSTIRFNTIVNTTPMPSDGAALFCDNTVQVTSNIFAYASMDPIKGQTCAPRYSLFDEVSLTSAGTGNQVQNAQKIFVNRGTGDYHLAAGSLARGGAEPGLDMVTSDLEGNPRPQPAGSVADCGAFEAP